MARIGIFITLLLAAQTGRAAAPETPKRIAGTEQVQVSLVLIDVVVRDRKDQPVSALTRDDFELRIDGVMVDPSEIESFEEVCETPAAGTAQAGSSASPIPVEPARSDESAAAPRHIVIYFDFSHMSMAGARLAMRGARDHVAGHLDPGDRVMILAYKNGLRLVQEFTADAALLVARIDAMRADSATFETDVMEEDANAKEVHDTPCGFPACTTRQAAASARAVREENRGRRSLEALTTLMPALAGLPGRKAVILFSEALREEPGAEYYVFTPITPREDGISLEREMLRLTSEANAAGVSFYTVFAGGMTADDPGSAIHPSSRRAGNDSAQALQTTLAVETGGRALRNTNDVGAILGSASRDLSCYYLLGYRYQGRGDNKRHSILVKLKADTQGTRRSGLSVRYRPYYNDQSAADRRSRLVQSALRAPALFHHLPVSAEAFALGPVRMNSPARTGRRVLVKATVPIAPLPLVPAGDAWLEGRLALLGRVTGADGEPACNFDHEMPLRIARTEVATARLVYETGCALAPGSYTLSLVVLDPVTLDIGARLTELAVVAPKVESGGSLSELYLWAREPDTLLVTSGLSSIGLTDSVSTRGLIPQSERRMDRARDAALSFSLCLPAAVGPSANDPLRIGRSLVGAGDTVVSAFEDLIINEPADPQTGCYQVSTAIRGGTLGDGIYKLRVEASGAGMKAPISREVDLAVE